MLCRGLSQSQFYLDHLDFKTSHGAFCLYVRLLSTVFPPHTQILIEFSDSLYVGCVSKHRATTPVLGPHDPGLVDFVSGRGPFASRVFDVEFQSSKTAASAARTRGAGSESSRADGRGSSGASSIILPPNACVDHKGYKVSSTLRRGQER